MKKRRLLLTALAVPALAAPRVHPPKDTGVTDPGSETPAPSTASHVDTRQEDPVLKARASRAAAQGIDERDLPPMPKALVEPPPLPPPETHPKDLPGYRAKHRRRHHRGKGRVVRKASARKASTAKPRRAPRHK